ncbi:class I SAM-dependent methyltransferase [Acidipila rosea]|uniref:Ubiquinone/menaquinone biosynthesis C-methylase UbiE n=1 Tax=Acidipila rosea TaxID=768535 RepID=A0A4V2PVV6_9BACT|nr:class I SAM-dependent methyltransferase [Acidipila rosea]MBW4027058.1 class I SAM-dependent methyltransferase [Acidobacteriota bacterium]MBW4045126.1 class I SAM-dependent methyltransferase [Acidobacteriota bacterium]TCK75361.1 ubiquinone/menaquinone biosynthesis C-methylase UbiE [Acidipila rosea]
MSPRLNFDRIARPYRWLEYLSFGPLLERCRFYRLDAAKGCTQALVLGDGDGRFLAKLLASHTNLHAEAADISPAMLKLLQRRVARIDAVQRLRLQCVDIRNFTPEGHFDFIATHFFLDCLSADEIAALIKRLEPAVEPGAVWIISEFALPHSGLVKWPARIIVRSLYRAFGLLTGLEVRALPPHAHLLRASAFERIDSRAWLGGLLISELWRKMESGNSRPSLAVPPA